MSSLRTFSFALALIAVAACAAPEPEAPTVDVAAVEAATAEAFRALGETYIAGDIEAASQHVTEDVHIMEQGVVLNGRDEYVEFVQGMIDAGAEFTSFQFSRHNIFVHPGAAYEYGTYDETVVENGEESLIEGNYFVRWEEGDDGRWRMDGVVAGPRNAPDEGM